MFCAELYKALPLSSQAFHLTAMWYVWTGGVHNNSESMLQHPNEPNWPNLTAADISRHQSMCTINDYIFEYLLRLFT